MSEQQPESSRSIWMENERKLVGMVLKPTLPLVFAEDGVHCVGLRGGVPVHYERPPIVDIQGMLAAGTVGELVRSLDRIARIDRHHEITLARAQADSQQAEPPDLRLPKPLLD